MGAVAVVCEHARPAGEAFFLAHLRGDLLAGVVGFDRVPRHQALFPQRCVGVDEPDAVAEGVHAAFVKQRHDEKDERRPAVFCEARLRQFFYGGMGDGIEPLPRLGIAEHAARKGGAVEASVGAENAVARATGAV